MTVLAFLPVSLFLLALLYLDSFKLVRPRVLIELIVIGCLAAAAGRGTVAAFGRCPFLETTVDHVARNRACRFSPRINCYRGPTLV